MSSVDFALTPVIANRDSDEITAVWLVPQLVLLNSNGDRKPLAVPSGGVPEYADTDDRSGYKRETSWKRRTAPENRVPHASTEFVEPRGPFCRLWVTPSANTRLLSGEHRTTRQVSLDS